MPGQRPVQGVQPFLREACLFCTLLCDWRQSLLIEMAHFGHHVTFLFAHAAGVLCAAIPGVPAQQPAAGQCAGDHGRRAAQRDRDQDRAAQPRRAGHRRRRRLHDGLSRAPPCSGKHAGPGKESCLAGPGNTYWLGDPVRPAFLASIEARNNANCGHGACLLLIKARPHAWPTSTKACSTARFREKQSILCSCLHNT